MDWWKKAILAVIILFVVVFLFNSVLMPLYVGHNKLVKVPSVIGLSFDNAKKVLDEADLEGVQGDIKYDASKPIGTILEQNPPSEQLVKEGRRIYLSVSGGEQVYDVPNLVGRTVRESKFALAQRNLELLEVGTKTLAQYPPGIVISQIEQAGAMVKKGTRIGVVVSTGMETGNLKVPELIGKNVEEAKKLILQNKLSIGKINYQPSTTFSLNAVIDQYPKANNMAKENERVDLFVNKKIETKEPPDQEMNSIEEVKPDKLKDKDESNEKESDKVKELQKEKKEEIKKVDKSKPPDKIEDKVKPTDKKTDKKKTDQPKEDNGDGTKF